MYGLLDRDFKYILEAVKQYPEITEVILSGCKTYQIRTLEVANKNNNYGLA